MELLQKRYEAVLYIDPDIKVFNALDEIFDGLKSYDCILVPHFTSSLNDKNSILNHELSVLKHGIFNLGFLGLNNSKNAQLINDFWKSRCYYFCERNSSRGVFTDQKFFDIAPLYFSNILISKNPGFNVASWNLFERKISLSDKGGLMANNANLIFYHFSSFDSGDGLTMSVIHGKDSPALLEVWSDYSRKHAQFEGLIPKEERTNSFNVQYKNKNILEVHRKLLREILINRGSISFLDFDQIIQ
jgi:hypothetical protein